MCVCVCVCVCMRLDAGPKASQQRGPGAASSVFHWRLCPFQGRCCLPRRFSPRRRLERRESELCQCRRCACGHGGAGAARSRPGGAWENLSSGLVPCLQGKSISLFLSQKLSLSLSPSLFPSLSPFHSLSLSDVLVANLGLHMQTTVQMTSLSCRCRRYFCASSSFHRCPCCETTCSSSSRTFAFATPRSSTPTSTSSRCACATEMRWCGSTRSLSSRTCSRRITSNGAALSSSVTSSLWFSLSSLSLSLSLSRSLLFSLLRTLYPLSFCSHLPRPSSLAGA